MTSERLEAPKPEVLYLKTVFRKVDLGAIRVPAFQRGFVWEEAQVIQLLESVYRGFPVGSLLLWSVATSQLRVDHSGKLPLPVLPEVFPTAYVLDGLQRLSTLYGVFHANDDPRFQVIFDLRSETFHLASEGNASSAHIALAALFDPKAMLAVQQRLLQESDGGALVDRSLKLLSTFQDYLIPVVTIEGRSVAEVVEIFERVNSTGTRLSRVDFMRAVTWSEEFDLGTEIDRMSEHATSRGFGLDEDTFVKLLGLGAGLAPTADRLLDLKGMAPSQLAQARDRTATALDAALDFLETEHVHGVGYLPYEGQLLVLVSAFLHTARPTAAQHSVLSSWLRSVSITEALRGKPDHYVARYIGAFRRYLDGGDPPRIRVEVTAAELIERRFMINKAFSAGLAALFASQPPRDLVTGEAIEPADFMREFANGHFAAILSRDQVAGTNGRGAISARVLANMVVVTDWSRRTFEQDPCAAVLRATSAVAASQLISDEATSALKRADYTEFLRARADALVAAIGRYAAGAAGAPQ